MPFCVCLAPYWVHWRVSMTLRLCISTTVLLLTGWTIIEFSSSSVLLAMEVLSCQFWQFLPNRSQYVVVDGYLTNLVNVGSGVPLGSVWSRCCSSCTPELFLYSRTSFMVMLISPLWLPWCHLHLTEQQLHSPRIAILTVSMWCDLWGMKLNASKTKTIIVSRCT